jgi:hypothetical protein
MKLHELHEGWFSKKEPKIDRQPIDDEEREMISRAFDFGHNAKLKRGNEYVLPDNVTLNYRKARVNFYKDGSKLMASVGYYSDEDGPGNPKKSPAKTVDRQIKGKEDLYNLKDELDGTASSSISSTDLKHAEMKKDLGR